MNTEKKAYTLSILVEDVPGVLSQVARLFSRKGYNIESICAGSTTRPGVTRISVVTIGDEKMITQLAMQLSKLLLVISVDILTGDDSVQRLRQGRQRRDHSDRQCVSRQYPGYGEGYADDCRTGNGG